MPGKPKRADRLSQNAFARKVGCAPSTINRMATDGRLPRHPDGSIRMPEGLAAYRTARAAITAPSPANVEAAELRAALNRAQVRERIAKAEQRELQLRQERDELVEASAVRADAQAAAELVRTRLLALPARVALQVEALAAGPAALRAPQIAALIEDEINQVLDVLHKARFAPAAHATANGAAA